MRKYICKGLMFVKKEKTLELAYEKQKNEY